MAQDTTIPSATSRYSDALKLHNQGVQFQEQGRFAEAGSAFRGALRAWETLPAEQSGEMTETLNGLETSFGSN